LIFFLKFDIILNTKFILNGCYFGEQIFSSDKAQVPNNGLSIVGGSVTPYGGKYADKVQVI